MCLTARRSWRLSAQQRRSERLPFRGTVSRMHAWQVHSICTLGGPTRTLRFLPSTSLMTSALQDFGQTPGCRPLGGYIRCHVGGRREIMSNAISALALLVSLGSLLVSLAAHRSGGPRVRYVGYELRLFPGELRLLVKVANSGRSEIDIEAALCESIGSTVTILPTRLKSGSSQVLTFRRPVHESLVNLGSLSVTIGLGTGETRIHRIELDDRDIDTLRKYIREFSSRRNSPEVTHRTWTMPRPEEI